MTERRYWAYAITCDAGCGAWHRGLNPTNLRRLLRGLGWTFTVDGLHYCPQHRKRADP